MKNYIKKLVPLTIATILFCACTSNEEQVSRSNEVLFSNLEKFNSSVAVHPSMRCSGFWDCLGHVTAVAGADIVGAAAGVVAVKEVAAIAGATTGGTGAVVVGTAAGVICGAGASYTAHKELKKRIASTPTPNAQQYGNLNIRVPLSFSSVADFGYDHNTVIHRNFFNTESVDNYYRYKGLSTDQIAMMHSSEIQSIHSNINTAATAYVVDYDYSKMTNTMLKHKYFTASMKTTMDLFLNVYMNCETDSEIEVAVNYYVNQVVGSSLSDIEKRALIAAFTTAGHSPYYFLNNGL